MELVIIRHGQSHVNLGKWHELDSMDSGLTDLGQKQAEALRDWLKEHNQTADFLYASSMKRTRETAQYVAEAIGLEPIIDDRIREIGNSYNDGRAIPEANLPRDYIGGVNPSPYQQVVNDVENAESWMHFRIRIGQFLLEMMEKHLDDVVYVVAHGGVMEAIFDFIYNTPPHRVCGVTVQNTGWTRFVYRPNYSYSDWVLHEHNRIDHLIKAGLIT